MKYANKSATGDAGEYFFAFTIADVLKWPCRLLDIDIGIDAQIEVLADDGVSLGDMIAVQIKATTKQARSVRISAKHLGYWQSVKSPVIIALVCLETQKIYWRTLPRPRRPLNVARGPKATIAIKFDETEDLLDVTSKDALRKLAYAERKAKIRAVLREVEKDAKHVIAETTEEDRIDRGPGPDHYIDLIDTVRSINERLARLHPGVIAIRKQIGTCGYRRALKLATEARDSLRLFIDGTRDSFSEAQLRDRDAYFEYHSMTNLLL